MFGIGVPELGIILIIVIVLFGAARIPEIAKALGKGIKELKKAGREIKDDIEEVTKDEEKVKQS